MTPPIPPAYPPLDEAKPSLWDLVNDDLKSDVVWLYRSSVPDWGNAAIVYPLTTGEYAYTLEKRMGNRTWGYMMQGPFKQPHEAIAAAIDEMNQRQNGTWRERR